MNVASIIETIVMSIVDPIKETMEKRWEKFCLEKLTHGKHAKPKTSFIVIGKIAISLLKAIIEIALAVFVFTR